MEIFMMDSMGWPYDSFDCLSYLVKFGSELFRTHIKIYIASP